MQKFLLCVVTLFCFPDCELFLTLCFLQYHMWWLSTVNGWHHCYWSLLFVACYLLITCFVASNFVKLCACPETNYFVFIFSSTPTLAQNCKLPNPVTQCLSNTLKQHTIHMYRNSTTRPHVRTSRKTFFIVPAISYISYKLLCCSNITKEMHIMGRQQIRDIQSYDFWILRLFK